MSAISSRIRRIRLEAGLNQNDLAAKLGWSASRLSRLESGEIALSREEAREVLTSIATTQSQDYLEYLDTDWHGTAPVPYKHPDWRLLGETQQVLVQVSEVLGDPDLKAAFVRRLDLYQSEISGIYEYLLDCQHTIAVIGTIGIGKTTAICHVTDLIRPNQDSPENKNVLEVGGGGTTICEVVIRTAPNYGIQIEPMSDDDVRKEVQDFAESLLDTLNRKESVKDSTTDSAPGEDLSISKEVERAIRNMAGLNRKRRKGDDGKRIVEDPALDLAIRFPSLRELTIEILTLMNVARRDKRVFWCSEEGEVDAPKWLQDNFADVNNGRNADFGLPRRIEILVPFHVMRKAFGGQTVEGEFALDICIIDTKGIDQTAERADLERHFYDPRTITVLCSDFKSAPDTSTQTLLKRALEAKALDLTNKALILVLPKESEARSVKDETGLLPESDEEGYELKSEQVELRLNALSLAELPLLFFNAYKDDPSHVKNTLIRRLEGIRNVQKERLRSVLERVRCLIDNKEDAQRAEVIALAANQVRTWVSANRQLQEVRTNVEDDLLSAIGRAHASTLRATLKRYGDWHNLNYSHHLSHGSRTVMAKKVEAPTAEFRGLINNLQHTDDFSLAQDFLEQVTDLMNSGVQGALNDVQVAGPAAFKDYLAEAQDDLWVPCLREWGTGRGFRERVKDKNEDWFEKRDNVEKFLKSFFEVKWQRLLDDVDDLLALATKDSNGISVPNAGGEALEASEEFDKDFIDGVRALLVEFQSPAERATEGERSERIDDVLSTLTEREEKVLRLRFGIGDGYWRTYAEVASVFNVSPDRVKEIEAKALRKLRHPTRARELRPFAS